MRIQKRDKELLQLIHRYGLLESRHIHAKCFRGISPTTMYRRLRKLEKDDYICRASGLKDGLAAYYLGKAGASEIKVDVLARYTNRNAYEHELAITDFRMAMEELGLCQDFLPERQVRKNLQWSRSRGLNDQVIPDGVLIEDVNGMPTAIALEMELNLKSMRRYKRVLDEYRFMRTTGFVWYVVREDAIKSAVFKALQDVQKFEFSPRIIVASFDEVIRKTAAALIYFDDGTTSTVAEFLGTGNGNEYLHTTSAEAAQCVSTLETENTVRL
ncbi:MAG: replication-relaxation family protein [Proteobacteria bacterium]|nr:replication-relaxation family protein [Pseudomonadota bacterium]